MAIFNSYVKLPEGSHWIPIVYDRVVVSISDKNDVAYLDMSK